jgi:hypothetical protein
MSKKAPSQLKLVLLAVACLTGVIAQADTILTFAGVPAGVNNAADTFPTPTPITSNFGSGASASSTGVSVVGAGTPGISLTWNSNPNGGQPIEWDYYNDARWQAVMMYNSAFTNGGAVTLPHTLTFTPASGQAVTIKSLNLVSYNTDGVETFQYTWEIVDANDLSIKASGSVPSFASQDPPVPVSINFTGSDDEPLTLELFRTAFSPNDPGFPATEFNIAMTQLDFAQVPEPGVISLMALGFGVLALSWHRRASRL